MAIPSHLPTSSGIAKIGTIEECTVEVKISDMQAFTVHFRRPDTKPFLPISKNDKTVYYDGSYGFDWLRDEYVYDIEQVYELGVDPSTGIAKVNRLYTGNVEDLLNEYTRLSPTDKVITEIASIRTMVGEPYLPAWLAIFPTDHNSGKNSKGVDLYLQVEQEQAFGKTIKTLCESASIAISFESDAGITVTATGINTLADLIGVAEPEKDLPFSGSVILRNGVKMQSKIVKRYKDISKKINIKVATGSNEVRVIKIIAKDKKFTRIVGLLCIYPNADIKKSDIKVVHCLTDRTSKPDGLNAQYIKKTPYTVKISATQTAKGVKEEIIRPSKWATSSPNEANIIEELQHKSFSQALIDTTVSTDYISLQNYKEQRIKNFLSDPNYQKNASYDHFGALMKELADIYYDELLKKGDIQHTDNKTTYLFLTEYIVRDQSISGYVGGAVTPTHTSCTGNQCKTIFKAGNYAIVFETKHPSIHNLVHELGHSFSLPHTFLDPPKFTVYANVHNFYRGYTDNIMDYGGRNKTTTLNKYTMNATFKWQWNLLRNDGTLVSTINHRIKANES